MTDSNHQTDYMLCQLTEREAGQLLGLSIRTLQAWRYKKEGPPFIQISRRAIRYRRSDLIEWANTHRITNKGDGGAAHGDV